MAAPTIHRAGPSPSPEGGVRPKGRVVSLPPGRAVWLAFAALTFAASAIVLGGHYWSIYRDTVVARTLLRETEEMLEDRGLDANPADLENADRRLGEAQSRLGRAWRRLQADHLAACCGSLVEPLVGDVVAVPIVGSARQWMASWPWPWTAPPPDGRASAPPANTTPFGNRGTRPWVSECRLFLMPRTTR